MTHFLGKTNVTITQTINGTTTEVEVPVDVFQGTVLKTKPLTMSQAKSRLGQAYGYAFVKVGNGNRVINVTSYEQADLLSSIPVGTLITGTGGFDRELKNQGMRNFFIADNIQIVQQDAQ